MNTSTRRIVFVAALLVVAIAGVRAFHMFFRKPDATEQAKQTTQAVNPLGTFGQPPPSIPGFPGMNLAVANQMAVYKLMSQHGLPMDIASYLAQAKAQVLSQTNTSVHFTLTFPDGLASDHTITITPDQKYTPTPAELEKAGRTGVHIYNVKFSARNESDTRARITLQYFVPYSAVPAELQRRIHGQSSSLRRFDLIPSAWAQEGGEGGLGMGVYQDTATEVAKEFLKQKAEHGKLSKEFPTPLSRLVDMLSALKKEQEHIGWVNDLDELRDCVENPTNPLTTKAFNEDPAYKQQTLDNLQQARSEVDQVTAVRFLNLATSVATDLVEGPMSAITSPVSSLNDETLKDLGEQQVQNARKSISPCDRTPMTAGQFRPMKGTIEYLYNKATSSKGGTSEEMRTATGQFVLNPAPNGMGFLGGNGTGNLKIESKYTAATCNGKGQQTLKGALDVTAEGGGTPAAGVIKLSLGGNPLTGDASSHSKCGRDALEENSHWENGAFGGATCEFTNVDLVHGGTYSAFQKGDPHGTCKIEVAPQ